MTCNMLCFYGTSIGSSYRSTGKFSILFPPRPVISRMPHVRKRRIAKRCWRPLRHPVDFLDIWGFVKTYDWRSNHPLSSSIDLLGYTLQRLRYQDFDPESFRPKQIAMNNYCTINLLRSKCAGNQRLSYFPHGWLNIYIPPATRGFAILEAH